MPFWDTADVVAPLAESYNRLHCSIRWNSNIAIKNPNTFTFESTYEDYSRSFTEIFKSLGHKKVSILNQESTGWNLAKASFIESAKANGIEILSQQDYLPDEKDFKVLALRAMQGKPDVILVNDIADNLELAAKQIYAINPDQSVTGYLDYPIDLGLFEGEHFVSQMPIDPDFAIRYKKEYGEPIYSRAHLAYDIVNIIDSVYKNFKKKPSTQDARTKLITFKKHNGMSGKIASTNNGKVFRTQTVHMKVENGKKVKVSR